MCSPASTRRRWLSLCTEVVTNAVEHGLAGKEGTVTIDAARTDDNLHVSVRDSGHGLPEGRVGQGLGTQIIRTLIQGELGGSIEWRSDGAGTEVAIDIPTALAHPVTGRARRIRRRGARVQRGA